ncbi:MAG: hypothetical protein GY810_02595 [Aureispira sp.]|nr:hypothetical protein [Aureispira sp.]
MNKKDYKYKNAGKGDFKNTEPLPKLAPEGLELKESKGSLVMTKSWRNPMGYVLLVFSLIWTGFSVFFIFSALSNTGGIWFMEMLFLMMPLFFVLLGVWMFYIGLQFIYNKSTVKVQDGQVFINTSPFARQPNKSLYKHEIKQIFVKKVDMGSSSSTASVGETMYSVYYVDQHGKSQPFFWGFKFIPVAFPLFKADEGRYFERKIEDFLNIEDYEVKEYDKNQKGLEKAVYNKNKELADYREEEKSLDIVPIPASLEIDESEMNLFIFREWRNPLAWFFIIFGLVWSSVVFSIAYMVLGGILEMGGAGLLVGLFLVPFIVVGTGLIYTGVATWVNTTTLHVNHDYLRVSHQPLPWKGAVRIPVEDIVNIEVKEETRQGKNGSYQVNLLNIIQKGKSKPVSITYGNVSSVSDECYYIEYKLKQFMKKRLGR